MVRELLMERLVRDCLKHIDLLESRLPMENADDEAFYKHSLLFGERVSCLLSLPSNAKDDRAGVVPGSASSALLDSEPLPEK